MPDLTRTLRSIRELTVVAIALSLCYFAMAQNQQIYLPNPTPRDPDLYDKYKDDPTEKIRQQQVALIRAAQRREQVLAATDRITVVAQQLKTNMEKHEAGAPLGANAQQAAEIEKLAKTIKSAMKSQ